jgi:hypothetical protein
MKTKHLEWAEMPTNGAELQRAVDAAAACRMLADCLMYGLITGPKIDVERCDLILEVGQIRGIYPSRPASELAIGLAMGLNEEMQAGRGTEAERC